MTYEQRQLVIDMCNKDVGTIIRNLFANPDLLKLIEVRVTEIVNIATIGRSNDYDISVTRVGLIDKININITPKPDFINIQIP